MLLLLWLINWYNNRKLKSEQLIKMRFPSPSFCVDVFYPTTPAPHNVDPVIFRKTNFVNWQNLSGIHNMPSVDSICFVRIIADQNGFVRTFHIFCNSTKFILTLFAIVFVQSNEILFVFLLIQFPFLSMIQSRQIFFSESVPTQIGLS